MTFFHTGLITWTGYFHHPDEVSSWFSWLSLCRLGSEGKGRRIKSIHPSIHPPPTAAGVRVQTPELSGTNRKSVVQYSRSQMICRSWRLELLKIVLSEESTPEHL